MNQFNAEVFNSFPILKTTRLTLREIRETDAPQIFAMRASGRVNQFIARPDMQQLEAAESLVVRTIQAFRDKQAIGWAGILRDNHEIIGTCGFNAIDAPNMHAEIGGEMATEFWGKNIAIEAVKAILDFGLNTMQLHTIEAKVSPQNRSAIYVLEQLGFEKEAHYHDRIFYRDAFLDMAVYTLIRGKENLD
jgi:[ribosomal protein S5]-alanine N-acetyltransferase